MGAGVRLLNIDRNIIFVNSWEKIKKDWNIGDNFPVTNDRILSAFDTIKKDIDINWFEKRIKSGLGKDLIVLQAVRLAEAFSASKKIGARKLTKKLRLGWDSEDLHNALNEAGVLVKLLPSSDDIEYEPRIRGISKKPDLLQHIGDIEVQYEIFSPEESADEKERTRKLTQLAEDLVNAFNVGCLDVYLLDLNINEKMKEKILDAVYRIKNKLSNTEVKINNIAFLVFDPKGNVALKESNMKKNRWILNNEKVIDVCIIDPNNDRSVFYKRKHGFKYRSPGLILFSKSKKPNKFTSFKLIRLFRPALDKRVFQKVIEESSQLSKELPSVVVINMGGPTVPIEDWADIVFDAFKEGNYPYPSCVWLRELHWGSDLFTWREILVGNPAAMKKIPDAAITSIFKGKGITKYEKYNI